MMTNAKIGTALVGGYLLGRTKKAKLAVGLGMFLAGRKMKLDPDALRGILKNSPVLGELNTQVREQIMDATKTAAKGALTKRVGGLADSLHQRTLGLRGGGEEEDAPRDDASKDDADRDGKQDEDTARPAPRRAGAAAGKARKAAAPARKAAARTAKPAARAGGKAAGAARKTAAKSTAKRTAKAAPGRRAGRGGDADA